jgi:DNA ligase 4
VFIWYVVNNRTIRKALGIGRDQKFRERCILDAELVLWDRDEEKILEFHELSSYVFNNKRYHPCPNGSHRRYPDRHVNLMAIFFDILLFDEHVLVHETYTDRTNLLSRLISPQPGRVPIPKD